MAQVGDEATDSKGERGVLRDYVCDFSSALSYKVVTNYYLVLCNVHKQRAFPKTLLWSGNKNV